MKRRKRKRLHAHARDCGCPHARTEKPARRDVDAPPPSSRRAATPSSYRFMVTTALVRNHRMTDARAARLVQRWGRLVETRMREGRSAASTAEHVERFERQHIAPMSRDTSRDPAFDRKALMKGIDADLKAKDKAKILALRRSVKEAEALAKTGCGAARKRAAERAKRIRERAERVALAIRRELAREKARSLGACGTGSADEVLRRKTELQEERRHQASLRRIEAGARKRRAPLTRKKTAAEARGESDDEVRQNIPEDLIPLFERVKRSVKGGPRKSRTEAFLQYVEEHPSEGYAGMEDRTDALIADLERQQRAGRRDARRYGVRGRRL